MMRWLALVLVACHDVAGPVPGTPEHLAAYVRTVAGADVATRQREVASWIVDAATWNKDVVEPYRGLYADYVREFDAQTPTFVARLAPLSAVTARRHFAGDPRLTPAQARMRWAVPVQFPSAVAELGGTPIDTVFLFDGGHWRALIGLDDVMLERVRTLDPQCEAKLERAGPSGRCTEIGWLVADAALRHQQERFAHACQLATTLCGTPTP
jgi:hypothetical protein